MMLYSDDATSDTRNNVAYWLERPTVDVSALYREQMVAFAKKALRLKQRMNLDGELLCELALDAYEREEARVR